MKPFFLSLLSVLFLSTSAQKVIRDPNAEVRRVSSFHGISISNAFEAYITQGTGEAVAVSAGDPKNVAEILTTVENGILKIKLKDEKKFWMRNSGNKKFRAYISVKNLDDLRIGGASDVKIEGGLKTNRLNLEVSGASKLSGDLTVTNKLDVNLSGASDVSISGSAAEVDIDASGASDVKAFDFRSGTCNVDASGACNIRITVDKELSADLSGASSVAYKGNGTIRNIKTSGASSVNRRS